MKGEHGDSRGLDSEEGASIQPKGPDFIQEMRGHWDCWPDVAFPRTWRESIPIQVDADMEAESQVCLCSMCRVQDLTEGSVAGAWPY